MHSDYEPEELEDLPLDGVYRLRGLRTTRIETFTDAAFAFALTLLVISYDTLPSNIADLEVAFRGIPAFAASFAMIGMFWYFHHRWSRRFGLEDGPTILLSFLLVFTVLIYVYPLRVMFSGMFFWLSDGFLPSQFSVTSFGGLGTMFILYGIGFIVMCGIFVLLNLHALREGDRLALSDRERFATRADAMAWTLIGSTGVASVAVAALADGRLVVAGGFVYCILPVVMPLFGYLTNRRERRLFGDTSS